MVTGSLHARCISNMQKGTIVTTKKYHFKENKRIQRKKKITLLSHMAVVGRNQKIKSVFLYQFVNYFLFSIFI